MVALHELHDVAQIVAVDIEMFLWPGQGQATRRVRGEVAQIPPLDKLAKSGNSRVLFQRAKRGNAELTMVLQCDAFGIFEFFRFPFFHQCYELTKIESCCCFTNLTRLVSLPHRAPAF